VLSVVVGLCAMLAVCALTGGRDKSDAARLYLEQATEDTGGSNIVNTTLVDYRAFGTFGAHTAFGIAGTSIAVRLANFSAAPVRETLLDRKSRLFGAFETSVLLRATSRVVGPIIVALYALLFFRGQYQTGGGFVAALVGSGGMALM